MVVRRIVKDEKGFTGLEAAIVLIAFITVAAVFSYVLLGAGFFATQKGQEVVHTGVQQVSSSIEVIGSIIGYGNTTANNLEGVKFTIQLAAGSTSIDLNKTVITVSSPLDGKIVELQYNKSTTSSKAGASATQYGVYWVTTINSGGADDYLEEFEKAEIYIDLAAAGFDLDPNDVFLIEIKPPMGASYPIELKVPPSIDPTMVLLQ